MDNPYEISMILLDKSYYDYDYEIVKQKAERHEQSEERTQRMMDRFGFGKVKSMKDVLQSDKASVLQEIILKEEQSKK